MKRTLEALRDGTFDLLILGGGITGAGVALDAALRGLRVALIDKGDFASGTSSISSKLVHGGLRYLEQGDIRLVWEALHERRLLLSNAPHLVHPLRFLLPFYGGARVRPWKWRVGLFLYDLLAGPGNLRRSRGLSRSRMLQLAPDLRRDTLLGGAEYHDAQMDDARLCLEVLKTAWRHGAIVSNYVEAIAFEKNEGLIRGVRVVDHVAGKEFSIRARQVLNATGPWLDRICRLAGNEVEPLLRPTKGVHLVIRDQGLDSALLLLHPRDGRVFFVIPWLGKTLIGTTDTEEDSRPEEVCVTPQDIEYLLEGYDYHFRVPLDRGSVLGHFVGLRPLLRSRPAEPSSRSREFRLFESPSGLLSAGGGKYTTYRHMAEVITETIAQRLGCWRRSRTSRCRLDGAPQSPWPRFRDYTVSVLKSRGLAQLSALHLVQRYGRRALDVADYIGREPGLAEAIHPDEPDLHAELAYQRDHEMALCPADFLLRRTRVGLFHPDRLATLEEWRGVARFLPGISLPV
jgi:glycerol-3-phosphate dehydrogenase